MELNEAKSILLRNGFKLSSKLSMWTINESSLNRLRQHAEEDGIVIISANKTAIEYDNQDISLEDDYFEFLENNDKEDSEESREAFLKYRNKIKDKELEKDIRSAGYHYSKVYGGYKDEDGNSDNYEPSFVVYNDGDFSELKDFAVRMCNKYKQDSVYIQAPGKAPIYVNGNGQKINSSESKDVKYNNEKEQFFTTSKRKKHGAKKFTADIKFESFYVNRPSYVERMTRKQHGEIIL